MPAKFDKKAYTAEYNRKTYHNYTIRFNQGTEADIIKRISEEGGPKDYITRLIRADIKARQRRNPYIVTGRKSAGHEHDHLKEFPFEVLEQIPGGYKSIGYAADMDDAAFMIMNYCDPGTPDGAIMIARRDVLRHSLKHLKAGTIYAKK